MPRPLRLVVLASVCALAAIVAVPVARAQAPADRTFEAIAERVMPRMRDSGDPQADMPVVFYGPDRAVVTAGPEKDASIEFIRDTNGTVRLVRVTGRIACKVEESSKP